MTQRLALITGGTRGIGEAICKELQAKNYKVVANYGNNDEVAKDFSNRTGIKTYKWDVTSYDACNENIKKIENEYGQNINILVNNAGVTRDGMLHKSSQENWDTVIQTNLTSCFNMCRSVIESMRNNSFGRIVSISSINGLSGQLGQTNYSASKAGIIGLTKALALECANKGITVNAVAPGYISTDMLKSMPEQVLNNIIQKIPVGRLGNPSEIARIVAFLANDDSGFITGETISVNGGQYMG
jgi:acetoacetyl-CoA reductase